MADVFITRESLEQYRTLGVQYSTGGAQAAKELGADMLVMGQQIQQRALEKSMLDYSNTMKQELFRIEQQHQGEPDQMQQAFAGYQEGFFAGIENDRLKQLLEKQFTDETQPYIRRAMQTKRSRLDDDTQTAALTAVSGAQQTIGRLSPSLFSNAPDEIEETSKAIETQMAIIRETVNLQKADGSYMFTPGQRAAALSSVDDAMKAAAPAAWEMLPDEEKFKVIEGKSSGQPLSVRNNNPGNLRGNDGEFRKFATPQEGKAAMEADLRTKITGKSDAMAARYGENYTPTLTTLITTYAPPSENDTESYIRTVAEQTGIAPNRKLTEDDLPRLMEAMVKVEGGSKAAKYFAPTNTAFDYLSPAEKAREYNRVRQQMTINQMKFAAPEERVTLATQSGEPAVIAAAKQIDKQLMEDAAGYVAQAPEVMAAAQVHQMAQTPETFRDYVAISKATQERLGTPPYAIRVLSNQQAGDIAASVTDAFSNGQDVHQMLMGMRQQYGAEWPRVFKELQAAKLPAPAVVLGSMDKEEQAPYAAMLARAVTEGPANVYLAAGQDSKRDINEALASEMDEFRQSVVRLPGGADTYSAYFEGASLLAAKIMQTGKAGDASSAAKQAAEIIANKYYNYEGTYRVPTQIDAGELAAGADVALQALDGEIMLDASGMFGKVTGADQKAAIANIKRGGFWVNTPEDDGLILMQEDGLPVARPDGTFIRYTYDELLKLGAGKEPIRIQLERSRTGAR